MNRIELERRLHRHILALAVAALTYGASKRQGDIDAAKELLLDEVERIMHEEQASIVTSFSKSVRRR